MKSTTLSLFVFCFCFCFCFFIYGCDNENQNRVSQVTIIYVYSDIETFVAVSCNAFDSFINSNESMRKEITSKNLLRKFGNSLGNFQKDDHTSSIDTRAKIYITYANGKKSVLCVDPFGYTVMDNKYMGRNEKIISFIKDNCKGFE